MRRLQSGKLTALLILALFAGTAQAGPAGIGQRDTIAAKAGKARTIAELAAMYDSSSCVDCHQDAHDQWAASPHARPLFGTGRTAATFRTAITNGLMAWPYSGVKVPKDVKVEHLMGCAKCHLPQLADATDAVASELAVSLFAWADAVGSGDDAVREREEKKLLSLNINCLVCHNRNAIVHKWTDGYPQKGVVYGSHDGPHDSAGFPKLARSPIMSESILCGQCHGLGPNLELDNPTQCGTGYGSYLWAYRAEGGRETCQDCHMRKSKLGHKILSYSDPAMIKAALDFEADAEGMYWRDGTKVSARAVVRVAMTNRSGHSIPDG
jgi:hypothetical protein